SNMASINSLDYLAVKNVVSRYCEALDSKDFDLLNKVFLPDVVADYPFNSNLNGVDAVSKAIQNRLGPIRTHHSLTTQTIVFHSDAKSASSATHFIGVHFGQGPHEGKMLSAYGRYYDELVLLPAEEGDLEGVSGASGIWRIKSRRVAFTQRIGDEDIMREF
ncbi:hypothetical protein CC86DRAFT_280366, partial [Ophiobolus disseminans]